MNLINDYLIGPLFTFLTSSIQYESDRHDQLVSASFCREVSKNSLSLLQNTNLLYNASKAESLIICKEISTEINYLILITENEIDKLEFKEKGLIKQLICAQEAQTKLYQSYNNCRMNYNNACAQLAEMESQESYLKKMLLECDNAKKYYEKESYKAAEIRSNTFKDLIPFVGLVQGIQTGHLERAIPFYSTIAGIASIVSQDQETYKYNSDYYRFQCSQLDKDISVVQQVIIYEKTYLETADKEISRLVDECNSLDDEIKSSGVRLTSLRNVSFSLKKLSDNYNFLTRDLDTLETYIEEDILEIGQIDNFSRDIQKIQRNMAMLALV